MDRHEIIEEFIARYLRKGDPCGGPDPTLEELLQAEEQLESIGAVLELMDLTKDQRERLRGLRLRDLADLMGEAADGLRRCPDVAREIGVDADSFERLAALDDGVGALMTSLLILHNSADNGYLLRASEAGRLLDQCDQRVDEALQRYLGVAGGEEVREAIQAVFDDAQALRTGATPKESPADPGAEAQAAPDPPPTAQQYEDRIRALFARALTPVTPNHGENEPHAHPQDPAPVAAPHPRRGAPPAGGPPAGPA